MTKKIGIGTEERYPEYVLTDNYPEYELVVSEQWYRRARRILSEFEELQDEIDTLVEGL